MHHPTHALKTILEAFEEANRPRLLVATHNLGKLREYEGLLAGIPFSGLLSAKDLDLPAPDETGRTFEANATLKANSAMTHWDGWVLADDSGLCVDALDGAPGVDTAYFGGWQKLLEAMRGVPEAKRTAHFVAVLVLAHPTHGAWVFRAEDHGFIATEGRGEGGFGYDPVFIPAEGDGRTFAEMGQILKAKTSHRARAVHALLEACGRG